ncbi:hypothetical protein [Prochlorococcus marinus]|uniref:hypothetical protein n=1 Tax=Prochlorococcus marinus TaxID=1219 RepID=UPI0005650120|nr:hypothetical protein [Prochlorococcus marinus]
MNGMNKEKSFTSFTDAIKQVYEDKEYKEVSDMSPRSRDASVDRFLTRLGTFLNNDIAISPMECLQRIYIMYDEEVNAK